MTEKTAIDGNLLLSVLGGLGRADVSNDGAETYIKDEDCVGGSPILRLCSACLKFASAGPVMMTLTFLCDARVLERPAALPPARRCIY